jgi:hypothetical protein
MIGSLPFARFMTGGKGFNVQAPEFGFGDIPRSAASQYLGGAFPQFQSQGLTSFESHKVLEQLKYYKTLHSQVTDKAVAEVQTQSQTQLQLTQLRPQLLYSHINLTHYL